jgi:Acetyltransferase (GNAT) domain
MASSHDPQAWPADILRRSARSLRPAASTSSYPRTGNLRGTACGRRPTVTVCRPPGLRCVCSRLSHQPPERSHHWRRQVGISHGPLYPERELGWHVYDGYEGQRHATEAAAVLRDWAARTLGLDRLGSCIDPINVRSIAVAERLGAVVDPGAPKQDPGGLVYRHRVVITPS